MEDIDNLFKKGPTEAMKQRLEDIKLANGATIITALYPDKPTITPDERHEASDALQLAIAEDPEMVRSCSGLSVQETRERLDPYLQRIRNGGVGQAA